ncbi:conjugative transfer protein MobI(A/C) [Sutterella sp.]|uniref:conjugative transfer protein MobI(A/C) n=1 Tax=Sutterella sp. TaxID=1981025 RepID=UPI003FD7CE58
MSSQLPQTFDDLRPDPAFWEVDLPSGEDSPEEASREEEDVAKQLFIDKSRLLTDISLLQSSIAYRAVRAAQKYFDWMKRKKGTDKQTYLRPAIRFNSQYGTVELLWVRRFSRLRPTKSTDSFNPESKRGRTFQIKTDQGSMTVFAWYDYLKKGTKDRYSDVIFKKEPAWVQKLGPELEDIFEQLRKEQKHLSAMRRSLGVINDLQLRQFSEHVIKELESWGGMSPKPLRSPSQDNLTEE